MKRSTDFLKNEFADMIKRESEIKSKIRNVTKSKEPTQNENIAKSKGHGDMRFSIKYPPLRAVVLVDNPTPP